MGEEWMVQPEGSFVPRSTIIIVTFDQGGFVFGFMDQCFFCPSAKPLCRSGNCIYKRNHPNMHIITKENK